MKHSKSIIAGGDGRAHEPPTALPYAEAFHGSFDLLELQELGINPDELVDMSSNILDVQHPASVRDAIASASFEAYPDRYCLRLRHAIASYLNVEVERILVGNGCSELIHLVASQWIARDDAALIVGPTFSEYRRAIALSGGSIDDILAKASDSFAVPTVEIERRLRLRRYGTVWICNPNNPTGQSIDTKCILRWAAEYPETYFVIDESYIESSSSADTLVQLAADNLIVLRSMTKAFALAGLRLGYLVASRVSIALLEHRRIPWSVNSVAQAAGIAVLQERHHYQQAMTSAHRERAWLADSLRAQGFSPVPSDANFFLLPVHEPSALRRRLLKKGILIRDCHSFGIGGHVRIAVGGPAANQDLIKTLAAEQGSTTEVLPVAIRASDDFPKSGFAELYPMDRKPVEPLREQLYELFRMRRDVRRFRSDALPAGSVRRWIEAACLAPSVGLSQPWRFVSVSSASRREQIVHEFEQQNESAARRYDSDTALQYRQLKLAGLREAPEQIAVFVDPQTGQGRGLGRMTMPESVAYSVVAAIQNFWLAARCEQVGVGWVSILRPDSIRQILDVPEHWCLIAYLCIGYPLQDNVEVPELESQGWESRRPLEMHWYEK